MGLLQGRSRWLGAVVALIALGACGDDGDDVTAPPEAGTFTLTVAAAGSGSGQVASASGVDPALSCTLAGTAAPAGACSASYPEGTEVQLTVTPEASSTFDGWAGDAVGCGTELSCSITMSKNQTITAQLSTSLGGVGDVQIVSSAFYPEADFGPDGAVVWVVEVRNVSARPVEVAEIGFSSQDGGGGVLASESILVGEIPPGETRVGQSFADYFGTEAGAEFEVLDVVFGSGTSNLGAAEIVSSDWRVDPEFEGDGAVLWTVEVRNTTATQLELVQIEFSTYDPAGKIVAADFALLGPIPPGQTSSAEGFALYHGTESTVRFQVTSAE